MESVGPFTATRVPHGPAAKIQGEVVVSFCSTDVRDAVKSAARNLAGKGNEYDVRLELRNHLKSSMKALQSVSYDIKSKYPDARRNVLFDDETLDIVLDFSLGKDQEWKRLTSVQAKSRKKKSPGLRQTVGDVELDDILEAPSGGAASDTE